MITDTNFMFFENLVEQVIHQLSTSYHRCWSSIARNPPLNLACAFLWPENWFNLGVWELESGKRLPCLYFEIIIVDEQQVNLSGEMSLIVVPDYVLGKEISKLKNLLSRLEDVLINSNEYIHASFLIQVYQKQYDSSSVHLAQQSIHITTEEIVDFIGHYFELIDTVMN